MQFIKLWQLLFQKKSKRKAWEWQNSGSYKFFTSSQVQKKYVNEYDFSGPALIFGTGWSASIHYCDEQFSTSTDCFILKTEDDQIDLRYMSYFLKWNISLLKNGFKWAWLEHISKEYLSEIQIPLPSLEVQKSIVAKLDKLTELIDLKKEAIGKTEELTKSVFLEMFGDPMINKFWWNLLKVRDFSEIRLWKMLDQKKQTHLPQYDYLWNSNVKWWKIEIENLSQMWFSDNDKITFELIFWDVLICEWWEVGRCAIWKNEAKDIYFQKALHRLRPNKNIILSEYIYFVMSFYCYNGYFDRFKNSATISHLTWIVLKEIKFPAPPIELQNHFAEIVKKNQSVIEDQEQSLQKIQELYDTTIQEVFSFS